ncbi:HAD family hydrolase [[Clostridium] innocuum]|uniref:HAD family hydrolase n=1 Tax=Clostridium innocuum TaxID=1522 RepID=UPI0020CA6289|nr:HAD hydrolase family protein [[Clostridium] innocuum]
MAIKLIALDLDGTLLTTQKTIDEETKKRLIKAQEMGISITLVNCLRKTFEKPHFMGFFFFLFCLKNPHKAAIR